MRYDNHIWLIYKEEYVIAIVMGQAIQLISSKLNRLLWKCSKRESACGALLQKQGDQTSLIPFGREKFDFPSLNFICQNLIHSRGGIAG